MSALYKHRGQPHTHTLNTNHGNPSVAQSFWCWEVDQTKAPECSTENWWLHNVTASLTLWQPQHLQPRHCFVLNVKNARMLECYMFVHQNSVASGWDKALSHRSAPLWKRSPRVILASACWIGRSHPNLIHWYGRNTYTSKEDMKGDRIWQPLCYTEHCPWLPKTAKGANNGLVGAASRGDEYCWLATKACHHAMQCWASSVCCTLVSGSSKQ